MDEILQRFIDEKPIAVMVQATIARTVGESILDDIFEQTADGQYTKVLTFSTLADLMTDVVFCKYPSVHAAWRKRKDIPVSVTSVYNKLNGLETGVSQALVSDTAASLDAILGSLPNHAAVEEPVKGLRLRTLDGNSLAGTDRRLECLRGSGAAALPGKSLAVRDGQTGLITDIVPCEDAYASERALYPSVLSLVKANDLWLADRNFCTVDYMRGIEERSAYFLIRHHAGTILHPLGRETSRRTHSGGTISEQRVRAGMMECRCIIIRLKKPTRHGEMEIRLLTNVPMKRMSARRASEIYRTRWKIEAAFLELTTSLQCEINTLGYPKAALFGFALAVVAYNLLVMNRAVLAEGLGEEIGGVETLSSYHMANEVAAVNEGMMIALPPSVWQRFVEMTAAQFATWLYEIARHIDWRPYRKSPRGPKKPVEVTRTSRGAHRATARELIKHHTSAP
jgi:IS4 transposase